MTINIRNQSIRQIQSRLFKKKISSVELVSLCLGRINTIDKKVKSILSVDIRSAMKSAIQSDNRRKFGNCLSRLDGIPVGVKDNISVKNQTQTCASCILKNYISTYNSTIAIKLHASGAILLGRLNLDEFAMGSSTENSAFQKTLNPWDLNYIPGGSSGGSAAVVASGQIPAAIGSDTGGSIRQPASLCGIVGIKPTYGRVSRFGLTALASSLDQIGPLGCCVDDVNILLQSISGHDIHDPTSIIEENLMTAIQENKFLKNKTIGILEECFNEGLNCEVKKTVQDSMNFYSSIGFKIRNISIPTASISLATYYIIAMTEASSNLARYDGILYSKKPENIRNVIGFYQKSRAIGLGFEVKRRILIGTYILSSKKYYQYYLRAQKARTLIYKNFMNIFNEVDIILTPTSPNFASKINVDKKNPIKMYFNDVYTVSSNLAGLPAISIPCGFCENHLPIGIQLIGRPFSEYELMYMAKIFEQSNFHYNKNT